MSISKQVREVRTRYDQLPRGKTALIRRCRTAGDVLLEGTYWRVAGELARDERYLAHVVLLFPLAEQSRTEAYSFGKHLRRQLGDHEGAALRVRRLIESRDRDELVHRMRGLLRLVATDARVDWGTLGADILRFGDDVRRRWAQDFYAPITDVVTTRESTT